MAPANSIRNGLGLGVSSDKQQSNSTIPCSEQTAREHARIWAELEEAGKMIGSYGIIVAATALERGTEVATSSPQPLRPFSAHHSASSTAVTFLSCRRFRTAEIESLQFSSETEYKPFPTPVHFHVAMQFEESRKNHGEPF